MTLYLTSLNFQYRDESHENIVRPLFGDKNLYVSGSNRDVSSHIKVYSQSYNDLILRYTYPLSVLYDMNSKSYLDNSNYFEGLFNLFVMHDDQLQVNFKTSSLMDMFREEELSLASFHQVLNSFNLAHILECDLKQNEYSARVNDVLTNFYQDESLLDSIFFKKTLEYISKEKKEIIENIEEMGLNIFHNLPQDELKNSDPLIRLKEIYMHGISNTVQNKAYFTPPPVSLKIDLWNTFNMTDNVDFLSELKNTFSLIELTA
jgi:hypothetical protein